MTIEEMIHESIETKQAFFAHGAQQVREAAHRVIDSLKRGGKLLIAGNGGSAADAQHLAAELVSRFRRNRRALPAIALTTDTSILTSIGNDFSYDLIFSRQVEALGRAGDILLAISTSGNSPNVLQAVDKARELGLSTIGLTGRDGGRLGVEVDLHLNVATDSTARAQEVHILIIHILCELIEEAFAP